MRKPVNPESKVIVTTPEGLIMYAERKGFRYLPISETIYSSDMQQEYTMDDIAQLAASDPAFKQFVGRENISITF